MNEKTSNTGWNTGNRNTGYGNAGDGNVGNWNTGDRNSGFWNAGNWNTGYRNSGNWNTGDWNTGDWNTGDKNTGDKNTGDWNTGDWNTGRCNTGNWNTGDRNSGDWNTGNGNTGCFNTVEQKLIMFNKPSDWTYQDWLCSDARYLLNQIPKNVVEWVCEKNMTDKEKSANPTYETTGGYLKVLDETICSQRQLWWDSLADHQRNIIKELPNFDSDIFEQCTGIKVTEK